MGKLKKIVRFLLDLPKTLYFNFHYLPFAQAVRLPIWLHNAKLVNTSGLVEISGGVKCGMIRLGHFSVPLYPNDGIMWENRGKVTFCGNASIGNSSKICVGDRGHLVFGVNFGASAALKCICYNKVSFGTDVLIGWDCLVSDNDFHTIFVDGKRSKGFGEIRIGANNWIAMQSLILKGAAAPAYCVLSSRTLLNKDFTSEGERILLAGQPARVVRRNVYHERHDDKIDYSVQ